MMQKAMKQTCKNVLKDNVYHLKSSLNEKTKRNECY